jgi:hypothetical protein
MGIIGGYVGALMAAWGGVSIPGVVIVALGAAAAMSVLGSRIELDLGASAWPRPVGLDQVATPVSVLAADRRGTLLLMTSAVAAATTAAWIVIGLDVGLRGGAVAGIGAGLVMGCVIALNRASGALWMSECVTSLQSRHGRIRFLALLLQAEKQGVLRQAGSVWQFRHADLQDRLAFHYEQGHPFRGHDDSRQAEVEGP